MMKKRIALSVYALVIGISLNAADISINSLLQGWLENDRDIKNAAISLQKAELGAERDRISNGFDITLSSGTMRFSMQNGSGTFTLSPSAEAKLPETRNLSLSAGSDIIISSDTNVNNISLKAGIDILDTNKEKRELADKKTLRALLTARRSIEDKVQGSEKSFYQNVKSLLKSYSSIVSSQNSLYTDKISFEKIKMQGFAETSSSYRLAEMKVKNDEHSIEKNLRLLNHDFGLFLIKCSTETEPVVISLEDFVSMAVTSITEPEAEVFENYSKDNFKEIEKILWDNQINSLSRASEKNYSLKGTAGYTFNNTNAKDGNGKNSDTIDAGVSSSVLGMNLSAGVSIPVNPGASPSVSAGISFSPSTLKKQKLTEKENSLSEQSESLSLESALYNYELTAADKKQSLEDYLWEKATIKDSLEVYTKNEKDMNYYYNRGIITLSEYLSAKTNKEKYEIDQTVNNLDLIIYNCEIRSLFYKD